MIKTLINPGVFILFFFVIFLLFFLFLFIYFLLLGAYCQPHNVRDSKFAVTEAYGFKLLIFQLAVFFFSFFPPFFFSFFLSFFLPSFLPSFFFLLSFSLKNKPQVKKRASIKETSLD